MSVKKKVSNKTKVRNLIHTNIRTLAKNPQKGGTPAIDSIERVKTLKAMVPLPILLKDCKVFRSLLRCCNRV